jgi:hypothetical protein
MMTNLNIYNYFAIYLIFKYFLIKIIVDWRLINNFFCIKIFHSFK